MSKKLISKAVILIVGLLFLLNTCVCPLVSTQEIEYQDSLDESVNDLPSSFSWCDVDGVDFSTSIKNQAPCPSCETYALVAALETMVQYQVGYPFNCDLSEMHLFLCSGGTCDWGVNITKCMKYLKEYGVPDEGCFPDPGRSWDTPCNVTLPGWENRTVKIKNWDWMLF